MGTVLSLHLNSWEIFPVLSIQCEGKCNNIAQKIRSLTYKRNINQNLKEKEKGLVLSVLVYSFR